MLITLAEPLPGVLPSALLVIPAEPEGGDPTAAAAPASGWGMAAGAAAAITGAAAAATCCTTFRLPGRPAAGRGTGDPTPKRVPLRMPEIAAACAPIPPEDPDPDPKILALAQFHADPKEETAGAGPPRNEKIHATNQLTMTASMPNALVGMWRTCKLSKSDMKPAKIAISGRNTPRNTMNVETPESIPLTRDEAVSIIDQ